MHSDINHFNNTLLLTAAQTADLSRGSTKATRQSHINYSYLISAHTDTMYTDCCPFTESQLYKSSPPLMPQPIQVRWNVKVPWHLMAQSCQTYWPSLYTLTDKPPSPLIFLYLNILLRWIRMQMLIKFSASLGELEMTTWAASYDVDEETSRWCHSDGPRAAWS